MPTITSIMNIKYNITVPRRLAIQLIIPIIIHNAQIKNPTHGINDKHKAIPSKHPNQSMTIGIVINGTIMIMQQIKVIKMRRKKLITQRRIKNTS